MKADLIALIVAAILTPILIIATGAMCEAVGEPLFNMWGLLHGSCCLLLPLYSVPIFLLVRDVLRRREARNAKKPPSEDPPWSAPDDDLL